MTIGAMFSWFCALVLTLIMQLRKLMRLRTKSNRIRTILKVSPEKKPSFEIDIANLKAETKAVNLTIIKTLGDMLPSGMGSGITLLLGNKVTDTHAGFGGLISALISCYEISRRIK